MSRPPARLLGLAALLLLASGLSGCVDGNGNPGDEPDPTAPFPSESEAPTPPALTVDFTWSPDPAAAGRPVRFTDASRAPANDTVTSWAWTFPDGTTSTDRNPTHTFNETGGLSVLLRVLTAQGEIGNAERVVPVVEAAGDPDEPLPGDLNGDAWAVIAIVDSGINPYHREFRDDRLTEHPSSYISGYPPDAAALTLSLNASFADATKADEAAFAAVKHGKLHWIPGTKIVGAYDGGDGAALNGKPDVTPIFDDDGHGTGAASLAVGNTIGSCPRCLVVAVESTAGLGWALSQPWIDVVSNSWSPVANTWLPLPASGSKAAAERGQSILFAAGNGIENGFVTPEQTYANGYQGPSWTIVVGASDGSGGIVTATGHPVDVAARGAGNVKAASPASADGMQDFGGTSAATPISAGVLGSVIAEARETMGDRDEGQREAGGKSQVLAAGASVDGSEWLGDGLLTRAELWRITFLGASAPSGPIACPLGLCTPAVGGSAGSEAYAGYGILDEAARQLALEMVLGAAETPTKPAADSFKQQDWAVRDAIYGSWDRGE